MFSHTLQNQLNIILNLLFSSIDSIIADRSVLYDFKSNQIL